MRSWTWSGLTVVLVLGAWVSPVLGHHEGDIVVGRTGAGQLTVEFDEFDHVVELPPVSGLLNGWAGEEPGFDHLEADEPSEDFYVLEAGVSVVFEVVSFDPAFRGDPLTDDLHNPGDQGVLGDELFHEHIDWFIDRDDPAFDPLQTVWEAQFKLVDTGTTNYADSQTYTLKFAPEPGTMSLLAFGGVFLFRRRPGSARVACNRAPEHTRRPGGSQT
jgi:hypothetical protein